MEEMEDIRFDIQGKRENALCLAANMTLCAALFITVECLYLSDDGRIATGAVVPVLFVLFEEWMGRRRPAFGVYWGSHAAAVVLVLWMAGQENFPVDWVSVAAVVGITVMGTYVRIRELRLFHPGWPMLLLGSALVMLGGSMPRPVLEWTGTAVVLISAVLCILWYGLSGIESALCATRTRAEVPRTQIQGNYRLISAAALAVAAVVSIPAALSAAGESFFGLVRQGLMTAIRTIMRGIGFLLSFLFQDGAEETVSDAQESAQQNMLPTASSGQNVLLERLTDLLFALILAAVLIWVVRLAARLLRNLRGDFARTQRVDGDRIEALKPGEKGRSLRAEHGRQRRASGRSPGMRIRQLYRKVIQSGAGAGEVRGSQTPRELEAAALRAESAQAQAAEEQIHVLYEKARYSGETCTAAEVSLMKDQIRRL